MKYEHGIIHSRSQALIDHACAFAIEAHEGQLRKYTLEPYVYHPIEVAKIVSSVTDDCECICAALLHDVIEDCGVTKQELVDACFGWTIAEMVDQLSDVSKPEDGNRKVRKEIDRLHTAQAWARTKTVKLADLISNTRSIVSLDPDFARVYMNEKLLMMSVLRDGNAILFQQCQELINGYFSTKGGDNENSSNS